MEILIMTNKNSDTENCKDLKKENLRHRSAAPTHRFLCFSTNFYWIIIEKKDRAPLNEFQVRYGGRWTRSAAFEHNLPTMHAYLRVKIWILSYLEDQQNYWDNVLAVRYEMIVI